MTYRGLKTEKTGVARTQYGGQCEEKVREVIAMALNSG